MQAQLSMVSAGRSTTANRKSLTSPPHGLYHPFTKHLFEIRKSLTLVVQISIS